MHVLDQARGPVLDIGCGPGRHVLELAARGILALGIDVTTGALDVARLRGAPVIERSVFDRVPGAGRWASALLLDGNIGIGADPVALLTRVGALLRAGGLALVELTPATTATAQERVRFEISGVHGPWFRWSRVARNHIGEIAHAAGFITTRTWRHGARCFAALERHGDA